MDQQNTVVSIEQQGACSACHAAGLCSMAEVSKKEVVVATPPFARYKEGDEVEVILKASMGFKAVWLAYCIPLVILLVMILGLLSLGASEVVASVSALAAIGLYYFLLWMLRDKLQNEYVFTIKG